MHIKVLYNLVRKVIAFVIATLMLCSACEFKLKLSPGDDQEGPLRVQRYDRLESRYLTTGDFAALQQMNTEFPIETRTLIEKVLQVGQVDDPEISSKFLHFFQDSTLQSLISDVESEYANVDDINNQLNNSFKKLQDWIPQLERPAVFTQIGSLDQSIVIGDKLIIIYLDKYMGENYPLYKRYYTYQQRSSMTRDYIVPDALCFYLLSVFPMSDMESRKQLERDLHVGKVMWTVNQAMGRHVFVSDYVKVVNRFMRRHKDITVAQLLAKDYSSKMIP